MKAVVRRGVPSDMAAAAAVKSRAWRESFAGRVPDEVLANQDAWAAERGERWASEVAGGAEFWVAEVDGEIVGVAQAGEPSDADAPAPVELKTLYVLARAKGTGVARRLLDAAIGDGPAYLWVLADNPRAHGFYAKHGLLPDGVEEDVKPGWPGARRVRLVRATAS